MTFPEQLPCRSASLNSEANTNDSPVSGMSSILSKHWRLHIDVWLKDENCHSSVSQLDWKDICPVQKLSLMTLHGEAELWVTIRKLKCILSKCKTKFVCFCLFEGAKIEQTFLYISIFGRCYLSYWNAHILKFWLVAWPSVLVCMCAQTCYFW